MSHGKVYEDTEARARRHHEADFWGQTGRSVRGTPVGEEQIQAIVDAVTNGLNLGSSDLLLDLCCGNGALSTRFFALCSGGMGVDFSDYLIGIAKKNFEKSPRDVYVLAEVGDFVRDAGDPGRFTKALCYGAFPYLPTERAREFLTTVRTRFDGLEKFFIGNLPDKALLHSFYDPDAYAEGIEDKADSPIGIWRTVDEFLTLVRSAGWNAEFRRMPDTFYAAHYRFDAVLTPR